MGEVVITSTRANDAQAGAFNELWADQFVAANPSQRSKVTVPGSGSPADVLSAVQTAVGKKPQLIIFRVGHGGTTDPSDGLVDLAPSRKLRITSLIVFYDQSSQENDKRVVASGDAILAAQRGAAVARGQKGRRSLAPKFSRRLQTSPLDDADQHRLVSAANARQRLAVRNAYDLIGNALRGKTSQVMFLTCNLGNSTRFLEQMASDWGAEIVAYKKFIRVGLDSARKARVFFDGDQEGRGSNTARARSEVPNTDLFVAKGSHTH